MLDFAIKGGPKPAPMATGTEAPSLAVVTAIADKLFVNHGDFYFHFSGMKLASGLINLGDLSPIIV